MNQRMAISLNKFCAIFSCIYFERLYNPRKQRKLSTSKRSCYNCYNNNIIIYGVYNYEAHTPKTCIGGDVWSPMSLFIPLIFTLTL